MKQINFQIEYSPEYYPTTDRSLCQSMKCEKLTTENTQCLLRKPYIGQITLGPMAVVAALIAQELVPR